MDADLLEACKRLADSLQHFYPLVTTASILAGFCLVGAGLVGLFRRSTDRRPLWPSIAMLVIGCLLASFPRVVDALTMSIFRESAPQGMSSVQVGSAHGLEAMVELAVIIVMLVGAYQILKGFILLKEAAEGSRTFWPAVTHLVGGVLCLNIRTFMLVLGRTFGGTLDETVRTLLGA